MMRHRSGKPFTDRRDHYQEVTDRIVAALEAGTRPWRQPWDTGSPTSPINATSGRRYHGINVLLLSMTSFGLGGGSPLLLLQASRRSGLAGPQRRARHDSLLLQAHAGRGP